jgi:histidine decarboxylase
MIAKILPSDGQRVISPIHSAIELRGVRPSVEHTVYNVENRIRDAHTTHLGYPYNLVGRAAVPATLNDYLINNLGDPYIGSHFGSEVCDLELQAVSWLMRLWQCDDEEQYWGSVGASGTEGNFWAIYLGREAFPNAVLLYSDDAHYSIPKAARILRIEARQVASLPNGEFSMDALRSTLASLNGRPVILALTCGTTVKGAHDNIGDAMKVLDAAGYGPSRRYVHVDGALNAMVLPFVDNVPFAIQPSFRHGIDSISTSGHKMIGTPMPCGVLIAKRAMVDRVASAVAYLRSNDTTLMGSRNGHAVLAIWARLLGHGLSGYRQDIENCIARTVAMVTVLKQAGVPVLCNPYSLTVVFPQPSEEIVINFQLACNCGEAHAIVMPNVTDALIGQFLDSYLNWWEQNERALIGLA